MSSPSKHLPVADGSRSTLLKAAKTLFAAKGLSGTTVKEICEAAQVNVSLVSYHFDGKEGLYRACLQEHGQIFLEAAERILKAPATHQELAIRLEMFCEEFFAAYLRDPESAQLIQRECQYGFLGNEEIFEKVYLKIFHRLVDFFKQAHKEGLVRKELDPQIVTMSFFGSLKSFTEGEAMASKFFKLSLRETRHLKKVTEHLLKLFLEGSLKGPSRT